MDTVIKPPHDIFKLLVNAWKKWRDDDGTLVPCRNSVRPQDIVSILPFVMILEVQDSGLPKFILVGEQIREIFSKNNLYAKEDSGVRFSVKEQARFHRALMLKMRDQRCGLWTDRLMIDSHNTEWSYQSFSLPLIQKENDKFYTIVTINLQPNDEDKSSAWHLMDGFDLEESLLVSSRFVDIGNGVPEYPRGLSQKINLKPPLAI